MSVKKEESGRRSIAVEVEVTGTPEEVSRVKKSYTGQALARAFGKTIEIERNAIERIKGQIA